MGLTQRLGTIPLAIQTDSSNNIGIGGSPSGSYKFEVTGTARVSGLLTGANATFGSTGTGNNIIALSNNDQSNTRLRITNTGSGGQTFSIVGGNPGASNAGLAIFDETNSATRLYISSAGNVGIGTSSPWGKFNVVDGTNKSFVVQDAGIADTIELTNYSSGGGLRNISLTASTLIFNTGNAGGGTATERMRITSGGNVGIGMTNPTTRLFVSHAASGYVTTIENNRNVNGDLNTALTLGNNCNNTSSYFLVCSMGIGDRMYIYGNGNIVNINNSYGVLSDVKLKENIVDATPKLENLLKVKIRNYNLIGEETKQIGVIAQELEEIFPSMVDETEDFKEIEVTDEQGNTTKERQSLGTTTKSVKMSVFVPMLIKAMQEQQEIINQLSAKVTALENK